MKISMKEIMPTIIGICLISMICIIGCDIAHQGWKTRTLEVGQVWVRIDENPFNTPSKKVVVDIQDGYVQYTYRDSEVLYSAPAPVFVVNSRLYKDKE